MAYTTIDDPEAYFQVKLWTGTGASLDLTLDADTDMQPDLVWAKTRNDTQDHQVIDSVRGVTKLLATNGTAGQFTDTNNLTAFSSDGFTVGSSGGINGSSDTLVAWCWKGGTTSGISGSADITPNAYSFNQTSGFSVVTYNGTDVAGNTVLHGIGTKPEFMIVKKVPANGAYDWIVYHKDDTAGLYLNNVTVNNDSSANSIWFNGAAPTSTVFSIGTDGRIGDDVDTGAYVFYGWAGIQGYSKFGSWVGNGNANGPFIYTGFRPAFILRKEASNDDVWVINDTKRSPINFATSAVPLYPHTSGAEPNGVNFDILSNGFKIRNTDGDTNTSGATFIYAAFAEAPFVNSNGVPCNAR